MVRTLRYRESALEVGEVAVVVGRGVVDFEAGRRGPAGDSWGRAVADLRERRGGEHVVSRGRMHALLPGRFRKNFGAGRRLIGYADFHDARAL